ncbi:NAD(P)-dependent alcohol dehydrogenase [Pyxidicoccus fallax]|uniref:NAD(P)-dependent alcohol dehydrogenase n=1 Tax=Pyxidicoccus fallax TaxID=394095 RepID=A0A848L4H1_9BACT|nr:NAD(P)-dependent alcohol dehydrogenase [Pyxidicoccus fallax]NMO13870.1 NAD(P)-dependent alcohol dehydrogenase [Pyxidicoccus fallax]NPC77662.1 NAD(P)-dependent alcohol dehydrogenase [Pyxidicoccus fallax]
MLKTHAYAAASVGAPLAPFTFEQRDVGPHDVLIDILYCGVCHSDIHQARDEWGGAIFPMVPGHEIVGRITRVGAHVTKFKVGDMAGVGCMVDSCRECAPCREDMEQCCEKGMAGTYNSTLMDRKTPTYGGYSTQLVVTERFALKVPEGLDPAAAAPLLCAGITTYSPLRQWNCKAGDRVAVVGLGGLGHMAVKLAASMGAEVTVLSTSRDKEADARRLGAKGFEVTKEEGIFDKLAGRFDLIIDTISAPHDYNQYLKTLRPRGTMVLLGVPPKPTSVAAFSLIGGNKRLVGSMIGGIAETQEMLDYCASKGVVSDIEVIPVQQINEAYERMMKGDVRYRFVIDIASLKSAAAR